MNSFHPIRTAVIGTDSLGKHHVKWLARLPQSHLVGVYDQDGSRAATIAAEHGVFAFPSLESLIGKVDAVTIVTTTSTHAAVADFCISHGIHCLIEKPVTATLAEAEQLQIASSKRPDVIVSVGQIERYNPALTAITSQGIRPAFIEAHRLAAFDPRGTDVAVVLDLMIHDIDLVLTLMQAKPIDIQAAAVAVISEQVDIANARLTFASGAVANLTASRISLKPMRKMRIFQKSGYYSLDFTTRQADLYQLATDEHQSGLRVPLGKSGREIVYNKVSDTESDMLASELTAFLIAVAEQKAAPVPLSDAIAALQVALQIDQIGRQSIDRLLAQQT